MGLRPEGTQEIASTFRMQLSASSHSERGRMWRLEVTDDVSSVHVLTLSMTMEQFGEAVSGLSIRGVDGEITLSPHHGKRLENRTVRLEVTGDWQRSWESVQDGIAAELERDGWKLQRGEHNWHRRAGNVYSFEFRRWVSREGGSDG